MNMVTLSGIVQTRYPLQELQQLTTNLTGITMWDQIWDTIVGTETGKANPDHSHTFTNIAAWVIVIPTEAALDHNTRIDAATTGAAHSDHASPIEATAIDLTMIHHIDHIADCPHTEALQVINPEITVGHIHNHPTDLQGRTHVDQVHTPADHEKNHTPRRTWWWRLGIHT